mmetsp:Transcript_19372/g.23802  ORF Transcript_19372/g.23802 Transcript_19372/m.23802 type:complete len:551 (-) Transcript_19372:175-1827(-)
MTDVFTREWKRPDTAWCDIHEPNKIVAGDSITEEFQEKKNYPCLVCGTFPAIHKCGRCRSTSYCSLGCQKKDFTMGRHKENCKLIGNLFKEKHDLEELMWSRTDCSDLFGDESTDHANSNDEESNGVGGNLSSKLPLVGQFWIEGGNGGGGSSVKAFSKDAAKSFQEQQNQQKSHPSTAITTKYCTCLLKLVQLLGRDESWRVKKTSYHPVTRQHKEQHNSEKDYNNSTTSFNDFCNEELLPLAGNPLALERSLDMALNLLHLDRTDMRVRSCIPSLFIEMGRLQDAFDYIKFWLQPSTTAIIETLNQNEYDDLQEEILSRPFLNFSGQDITKSVLDISSAGSAVHDFNLFYPNVGMVFELALIKIKLSKFFQSVSSSLEDLPHELNSTESENQSTMLKKEANVLLSTVHGLNSHLLPPMGDYVVPSVSGGGPPAAVQELLNHMPGYDLQYRMGNAGGGSKEEAIGIWQKDMVIWDNDRQAMEFLRDFCADLATNLLDYPRDNSYAKATDKAKELITKLKEKNPKMSADQIMMHPEMAKLMLEQIQECKS